MYVRKHANLKLKYHHTHNHLIVSFTAEIQEQQTQILNIYPTRRSKPFAEVFQQIMITIQTFLIIEDFNNHH